MRKKIFQSPQGRLIKGSLFPFIEFGQELLKNFRMEKKINNEYFKGSKLKSCFTESGGEISKIWIGDKKYEKEYISKPTRGAN